MNTTQQPIAAERGNIETFLEVNSLDITHDERQGMEEAACKAMSGAELDVCPCPPHLRDAFRRIVTEAAYKVRVKGEKFNPKAEVMPKAGDPYRTQLRKCNFCSNARAVFCFKM
jgi:hypothetical protein